MQQITILGSTGSIGKSTLDVVARHSDLFRVFALTANTRVDELYQQCIQFEPQYAVLANENLAHQLRQKITQSNCKTEILAGPQALCDVTTDVEVDMVMAAIVGAAGLLPTLAGVKAGKKTLLANKEALVMSGQIFMQAVEQHKATLLPIDSEHNAIFQCLPHDYMVQGDHSGVEKILLTGSGGPFRERDLSTFENISVEEAINHPNWNMGPKISVDSATMMNKGLELIEACWMFDLDESAIEIVLHKQSIIHSMVSYVDGSVLAQMGNPDMRTPIAHAMAWPDRIDSGVEPLNLFQVKTLDFSHPDKHRFPCLNLSREAMKSRGSKIIQLNAANEIAVEAFLQKRILFTHIHQHIDKALNDLENTPVDNLESILAEDERTRNFVLNEIAKN